MFAKKYRAWKTEDWKRVIFSDESIIDKNNRRKYYFKIPDFD
jgi:hypothetical protein